jgi:signal transduction histidine kinase
MMTPKSHKLFDIVIVEDTVSSLKLLSDILHLADYRVRPALTAMLALKSIENSPPDLILLDVKMPEFDGYELCRQLKTRDNIKDIPIIFVSALNDTENMVMGFEVGGVDYITKPFHADEVLARIKTHLTIRSLQLTLEQQNKELNKTMQRELEAQAKLLESEKMASLGRTVAGIAHELNTPMGLCVTAASYLQERSKLAMKSFRNHELKLDEVQSFLETVDETVEIVTANLIKVTGMVNDFKMVAVDVSSEKLRSFVLHDYLNRIINSLSPELRKTRHQVSIVGDDLMLESYPGALSQVITNIIMNSITHAYDPDDKGQLIIRTIHDGSNVHLNCSDDGKGMNAESLKKVFEAYYTTREGIGGSGLGTNIIYKLVTETLQGEISCSSELGIGTMFTITIPLILTEQG